MQYPVPSMQYPVPSMQYPEYTVCSIQYPVSSIQYPVPSTKYPVHSMQYPVSSMQYPVPSIQYPSIFIDIMSRIITYACYIPKSWESVLSAQMKDLPRQSFRLLMEGGGLRIIFTAETRHFQGFLRGETKSVNNHVS